MDEAIYETEWMAAITEAMIDRTPPAVLARALSEECWHGHNHPVVCTLFTGAPLLTSLYVSDSSGFEYTYSPGPERVIVRFSINNPKKVPRNIRAPWLAWSICCLPCGCACSIVAVRGPIPDKLRCPECGTKHF